MVILLGLSIFAAAQKTVAPIVQMNPTGEGEPNDWSYLLGGVENGKYLDAKTTFGKMKKDEKFSLLSFEKGNLGESLIGEIKEGPGACLENYFIETPIKTPANLAVGSSAKWNVFPRKPQNIYLKGTTYQKSVADVLRERGLTKVPVNLKQTVLVDLDGDGTEEVLLVANRSAKDAEESPSVGTYSVFVIRKIVGGKVQNIVVGANVLAKKSDYFDGNYTFSGVADLNGDGKLEIIAEVTGYEENSIKVFELKGGKISEIKALSYYCGA